MIRKYAEIFCWKNVSSFCSAKATHIFSAKNIRILCIEPAKTVNEMTLNKLVKLTMLWTTGPWSYQHLIWDLTDHIIYALKGMDTPSRENTLTWKFLPPFSLRVGGWGIHKGKVYSEKEHIFSFKNSPYFWKVSNSWEATSCMHKLSPFAKLWQSLKVYPIPYSQKINKEITLLLWKNLNRES